MIRTFEALAYLVKSVDPKGIELVSTPSPHFNKSGKKKISGLVMKLENQGPSHRAGTCNMESSLSPVFDEVKARLVSRGSFLSGSRRPVRGANVYIFTDAIWEGGDEVICGVQSSVEISTKLMKDNGKDRTSVVFTVHPVW